MSALPYTAAALVVAGVAGSAALSVSAQQPERHETACELRLETQGGALLLQARAHGASASYGTYRLSLRHSAGGGQSTIRQSGDFSIDRDGKATLTEISLPAPKADFEADLTVTINGRAHHCTRASL